MRAYVGGTGKPVVLTDWVCPSCDVTGRDPEVAPSCWSCGGPAKVIARPTVMVEAEGEISTSPMEQM